MQRLLRKTLRGLLNYDPSFCDMYEDAHASQAAQEYLGHIRRYLRDSFGDRKLAILDAGCQAGRLLIPLAEAGHRLIGIDTSAFALRRTARHVKEKHLSVTLHAGNLANVRRWVKPASLDAVICAEVLYLCDDYRDLLKLLAESVKSGGLILASHRPAVFYAAKAVQQGRVGLADTIAQTQEGPSSDGAYHNWQTEDQLKALYGSAGLQMLGCHPVDQVDVRVELDCVHAPNVRRLVEPLAHQGPVYRVPQYYLVAARKS